MFNLKLENFPSESSIERIEKLSSTDHSYQNSVKELAEKEDYFRDQMAECGLDKTVIDKAADLFSTETLEKMEAQRQKYTDFLTGLGNRFALMEFIPKLISLDRRNNKKSALLMMDLDHFKSVNDNHGHDAGDVVLRQASEIIRANIRQSDFLFRYGGEEFIIFLSDTNSDQAKLVADKIRQAFVDNPINIKTTGDQVVALHQTISIGCVDADNLNSTTENDSQRLSTMINLADQALYSAKDSGRNRVVDYKSILLDNQQVS